MKGRKQIAWSVLSHGIAAAIAATVVTLYDRIPFVPDGCVKTAQVMARNNVGDVVVMRQKICGGLAFSTTATLELKKHNMNGPAVFLSYEINDSGPIAKWDSKDLVSVYVYGAGKIFIKKDIIDGVIIHYTIASHEHAPNGVRDSTPRQLPDNRLVHQTGS